MKWLLVFFIGLIWVSSVCQTIIQDSKIIDTTGMAAAIQLIAAHKNISQQRINSIYHNLIPVEVIYISFDGKLHSGVLVVNKSVKNEIITIFNRMLADSFPIYKIVPANKFVIAKDYNGWDDNSIMQANVTTAFNLRIKTNGKSLSSHAFGLAIDINPIQNPYIKNATIVLPKGSSYIPTVKGTISLKNIVNYFYKYGWQWGGRWRSVKDYQHFEKKQ